MVEYAAFLDRYCADGTFLVSGRKVPRTGGVILACEGFRGLSGKVAVIRDCAAALTVC